MKVLTICSHKGGTGKTTTAVNLSSALALTGHKTLLIDMDPQGFLTSMLGLQQRQKEGSCLMLFEQGIKLTDIQMTRVGSLDVLPSSHMMTSKMRHLNKATDVFYAKEALHNGEHDYDMVIFDTAAAITVFSLNALVTSDNVLIPVTPEYQPVMGAEQTVETIRLVAGKLNPKLADPLFVLTQVDGRKTTHQRYREYMQGRYPNHLLSTEIRTCSSLANSYKNGATVFDIDLNSRGAHDYAKLTDAILPVIFKDQGEAESKEPEPAKPSFVVNSVQ
ncbi:MAG: ParA family protein [Rhodothermales bacterium]